MEAVDDLPSAEHEVGPGQAEGAVHLWAHVHQRTGKVGQGVNAGRLRLDDEDARAFLKCSKTCLPAFEAVVWDAGA
ncbi:MAG: hypothetical protein U1E24_00045 [Phenylobacterium sp.]|nr:hypothetical protein [Phenylobacterium sp.]